MNPTDIRIKIKEAKELMRFHKPNRNNLGSQYYYWEMEYQKLKNELKKMATNHGKL